jgi:hypothetical protein
MNAVSKPEASRGPWPYFALLAAETAGIAVILWNGLPIYHEMMRDVSGHQPSPGVLWWAWAGVILTLSAYMLRVRLRPPMPRSGHAPAGHVIFFLGRLSFVVATSTFSFVFINHLGELNIPAHRMVLIMALLFAMFCWNLELERLAKTLIGTAGEPRRTG